MRRDARARTVDAVLAAPGRALDADVRATMEERFRFDFSQVRVHAGGEAAVSARALGARAYSLGAHLVFGAGHYAPERAEGRGLLAHELTHVVQRGGSSAATPTWDGRLSTPADGAEREADRNAAAAPGEGRLDVRERAAPRALQRACLPSSQCAQPPPGSLNPGTVAALGAHNPTHRYSVYFTEFLRERSPEVVSVPSAWIVSPGHPSPASSGPCPTFVTQTDPNADECIEVSEELELGAKEFLEDIYAETIGGKTRAEWEIYADRVGNHEADHIPRRRNFGNLRQGLADRNGVSQQDAAKLFGILVEFSSTLAELPVEHEYRADFYEPGDEAAEPIRKIVRGGGAYGYDLAAILKDLCCRLECGEVAQEVLPVLEEHAARWTPAQARLFWREIHRAPFCDGKLDLTPKAPMKTWNPALGPPA